MKSVRKHFSSPRRAKDLGLQQSLEFFTLMLVLLLLVSLHASYCRGALLCGSVCKTSW